MTGRGEGPAWHLGDGLSERTTATGWAGQAEEQTTCTEKCEQATRAKRVTSAGEQDQVYQARVNSSYVNELAGKQAMNDRQGTDWISRPH